MLADVKGFAVVPTVDETDVDFVQPKVENAKVTQYDIVSAIVVLMMVFFSLTTLVATFMLWSQ